MTKVKLKLGDFVMGQCAEGHVVALSEKWCVYRPADGDECAEPIDQIFKPLPDDPTITETKEVLVNGEA